MSLINVKFLRSWDRYNAGEHAGFTAEALTERINVGGGPEQQLRIPRGVYEPGNDEAKAALERLFAPPAPAAEPASTPAETPVPEKPAETAAPAETPPGDATPTPPAS